jgi:glycosyltransferase involved in cell wall biosynthesis
MHAVRRLTGEERPLLSVVLCTYNRARMAERALLSVCRQSLRRDRYEIIVVDNNSRDETADRIAAVQARYPDVVYVKELKQGLSHARNRGFAESSGDYVLYMDDDAIAPSEYLETVARLLHQYAPDILGGPIYPFYVLPKPRWFRDDWEIRRYAAESGFALKGGISGSNFVIRRPWLERIGMFDPALGMKGSEMRLGEDRQALETYRALVPEAEQRVYYALEAPMLHLVPAMKMQLGYMLRRHFAAGRLKVTVKGTARTWSALGISLTQLPGKVCRKHLNLVRDGWAGVDVVEAVRRTVFELGVVYEGFRFNLGLREGRDRP